MRTQPEKRAAD